MDIDQHPFVRMAMAVAPVPSVLTALLHLRPQRDQIHSRARDALFIRTLSSLAHLKSTKLQLINRGRPCLAHAGRNEAMAATGVALVETPLMNDMMVERRRRQKRRKANGCARRSSTKGDETSARMYPGTTPTRYWSIIWNNILAPLA
jgi:hypothetical protein